MHVLCRAPLCNLTALPSPRRCTGVTTSSVSSLAVCWTRTQSSKCVLHTRRGRVSRVLFGGALLDALGLPGTRSFGPGVALLLITLRRRGPQPRSQAAASCVEGPTASPMVLPTVCADVARIAPSHRACCSSCTRPRAKRRRRNSSCSNSCRISSPTRRTPMCGSARRVGLAVCPRLLIS